MSQAVLERAGVDESCLSEDDLGRLIEGAIRYNNADELARALKRVKREADLPTLLNQYRVVENHGITHSLLTFAARQAFEPGVQSILESGASSEILDSQGYSYLHHLAWQGNINTMQMVFNPVRDAHILNTPSASGHTPLQLACEHAPLKSLHKSVSFLLEKGASPHLAYYEKALPIALLRARAVDVPTSKKQKYAKTLYLLCSHGALIGRDIDALDLDALISMLPNETWMAFGTSGYAEGEARFLRSHEQFLEWQQVNVEEGSSMRQHVLQAVAIYWESLKTPLVMPPHVFVPSSGNDGIMKALYSDLGAPRPILPTLAPQSALVEQYRNLLKFVHALYLRIQKQSDYAEMPKPFLAVIWIAGICSALGVGGIFTVAFLMAGTNLQRTRLINEIDTLTPQAANNTAITPSIADLEQQRANIPNIMSDLGYAMGACLVFAALPWALPLIVSTVSAWRETRVIEGAVEERRAIEGQVASLKEPSENIKCLLSKQSFLGVQNAVRVASDALVAEDVASYQAMK